jgi:enediyne biosynthesis protein E4
MATPRRVSALGWTLAAALFAVAGCQPPATAPTTGTAEDPELPPGPPLFRDVTATSHIDFSYRNGEDLKDAAGNLVLDPDPEHPEKKQPRLAILESLGGGVAVLDYDGDGLLDVFITGGGYYDGPPDYHAIKGHPCRLYHNLGNCTFEDVTEQVGLDKPLFYTHGAAVADYDRDGWPDLLVTGWDRLALYHNVPDGKGGRRFEEVSQKAGVTSGQWSSSAGWADLDGDGYPDLYVCHYVNWSFANNPPCAYDGKTPDVCPPTQFRPLPHQVFRNKKDGTFEDVSKSAGLRGPREEKDYAELKHLPEGALNRLKAADKAGEYGKGLGVLLVDVNGDGKPDVYVCNDTVDNFLYVNRSEPGKILLEEVGLPAGVARDDRGSPNGSMGVDAADYDGCGRPSIWVTNYEGELHALYHNECKEGRVQFSYQTQRSGVAALGQVYVGWGTGFLDLDHHGWQDLFIADGHAIRFPQKGAKRRQRPVLLRNLGQGKFRPFNTREWPYFKDEHCARGVAFADLDNDGRIDLVISHINEPVAVLRNEADVTGKHWLGVELHGKEHCDVVGAKVVVRTAGGEQTRFAKGGGSYASANDPRHVFGLGDAGRVEKVTVIWPSGQEQVWEGLAVDRYWKLTEGEKEAK